MSDRILMRTSSYDRPSVNLTPDREPRCRYHNRYGDPCPNPSLDPDPLAIQICIRHLSEAIALYREHASRITNDQEK